jgi:PKD repeat protein
VTEADADSDMTSQSITVSEIANEPPVAEAGGPYSGDEGSAISFDASASSDIDGTITLYEWDWDNDGTYDDSTTSATITHTWYDDYSGTIGLRVTDDDGATDTDTASVTVNNVSPAAEAGGPYSGDEGSAITLNGSATDPGSDTMTYAWDLDNNGSYETPGQNVSNAWAQNGTYTVGLRVTDDDGGVGIDTASVIVNDLDPAAAFSYSPASPVAGETVSFTDGSTSYDGITSWLWDFGDGNTSTQQNPAHPYQSAGTYTVSLTVTEADADSDTTSQSITVSEGAVNAWSSGDLEPSIWSETGHPRGRDKSKDYSYTPDSAITNVQLLRAMIGVLTYDGSGSASSDLVLPYLEVHVKVRNKLTQINGRITPIAAGTYIFESTDAALLGKVSPGSTNEIRIVIGSLNKDRSTGNNDLVEVNYVEVEIEYQP